jgi:hypothetical protein
MALFVACDKPAEPAPAVNEDTKEVEATPTEGTEAAPAENTEAKAEEAK